MQVGDVEWKYLRFIQEEKNKKWKPAAGGFEGWPKTAKEIRYLDPCMGSGHFIVFALPILVAMRQEEEKLSVGDAVDAVIRENLYGLELDPRCTQIAAFNLAWTAWMMAGYRALPEMNLACCGLALHGKKEAWEKLGGKDTRLQAAMGKMYDLFKDAPVLGSLINPRKQAGNLIEAEFHEIQPLLSKALAKEEVKKDENLAQMGLVARGNAKAAEILAGYFTLVATNVPYLKGGEHGEVLKEVCERFYPESKYDLATVFIQRSHDFLSAGCHLAIVTQQYWLFLKYYEGMRETIILEQCIPLIARLGPNAFQQISGEVVNVCLQITSQAKPDPDYIISGIEVDEEAGPNEKSDALVVRAVCRVSQNMQLKSPDKRILLSPETNIGARLATVADFGKGSVSGDGPHYIRKFWEVGQLTPGRKLWLNSPSGECAWSGREHFILWGEGGHNPDSEIGFRFHGQRVFEKRGVAIGKAGSLRPTIYLGELFDDNMAVVCPYKQSDLAAMWVFASSKEFEESLRRLDKKMSVTAGTFTKVPFDLAYWQKVAGEKYPHGLPKPFSSDPTQWLFNGHPAGADQPLHVAVARLLGYQWPRQTGSSFPDCPALGPDGLEKHQDNDGIVCLNPISGEAPAADRLQSLLSDAYGKEWKATTLKTLLEKEGSETTEEWLRNKFFESHCALFHRRPFIWQIWDGKKDGFSALVNYHKLNKATLEKLTYVYLGDWIKRQEQDEKQGKAGATGKKEAALELQNKLKLIIEGEAPYDIFIRWKPLAQQAIGWNPDLNDGVRLNIRPFVLAGVLRKDPKVGWEKGDKIKPDKGTELARDKSEYPWFWCEKKPGTDPTPERSFSGRRWNCVHLTLQRKKESVKSGKESSVALRSRGLQPEEQSLKFE